jgi:hypothetical protein
MTWLIGVPFSMILGIVAPYATLRQAPVPRNCGEIQPWLTTACWFTDGMYGQIPAYLNHGPRLFYRPLRGVFEMVVVPGSGSFSGSGNIG